MGQGVEARRQGYALVRAPATMLEIAYYDNKAFSDAEHGDDPLASFRASGVSAPSAVVIMGKWSADSTTGTPRTEPG